MGTVNVYLAEIKGLEIQDKNTKHSTYKDFIIIIVVLLLKGEVRSSKTQCSGLR